MIFRLALVTIFFLNTLNSLSHIKNDSALINGLNTLAFNLLNSNSSKAKSLANEALAESKKAGYNYGIGKAENILGLLLLEEGQGDSALIHFNAALKARIKTGIQKDIASCFNNIGKAYEKKSDYNRALEYYLKALKMRQQNSLVADLPKSYNNIAEIYQVRNDFKNALRYYRMSLSSLVAQKDESNTAAAYNNIGSVFKDQKAYDSALFYFNKALEQYSKNGDSLELGNEFNNIGAIYTEKKDYRASIRFYETALKIANAFENEQSRMEILVNMGEAYKGLKNYGAAENKYLAALAIARKNPAPDIQRDIYLNLSENAEGAGNYEKAYFYHKKFSELSDSILNTTMSAQMADMLSKYKADEKQAEADFYRNMEHLRKRALIIVGIFSVIAIGLLGLFLFFYRQKMKTELLLSRANAVLAEKKIDDLLRQQEIRSYQAMISGQEEERRRISEDLHDRLGVLLSTVKLHFSALDSKMDLNQDKTTSQLEKGTALLDEACREVRRIAHNMSTGLLRNTGLVPALEDLKDTIENASGIKVSLTALNMEKRIESNTELSVYRTLQELMSNIMKHSGASEVNISLSRSLADNILSVMVEDNGKGFDKNIRPNGIGLQNIAARVERLAGKFTLDSAPGQGTTAVIEIPLNDQSAL